MFQDGKLTWAGLVKSPVKKERGPTAWKAMADAMFDASPLPWAPPDVLILEIPQVYAQKFWKGDPADLIELAGVDGALTYALDAKKSVGYLPHAWKGTVPKPIHNARILSLLSPAEKAAMDLPSAESLRHNVYDGIGLGLHYLTVSGLR